MRKELIFGAGDFRVTRWWPQARIFRGGSQVILVDRQHSTTSPVVIIQLAIDSGINIPGTSQYLYSL